MNQDDTKTICPRCGKEMSSTARYCLQCGYLNPNVQENQGMKKFINKRKDRIYEVGDGQVVMQKTNQIVNSIGNNTGSKKLCFILNYFIYMFIIIFSFFSIIGSEFTDFNTIKNSLFPYVAFITSIVFLYVYSMELVFMKANKKWWYALIPFYNLFVLCDIVFRKKILGIILLIPIIGQLFLLIVFYKLAIKFEYSGILTVLFPIIFIPLMGFGSRLYEGINYVNEEITLEKDYKRKRIFFISLMVFLISGAGLMLWNNIIELKSKSFRLVDYYYLYATKGIVDKTKILANHNYLECDKYKYNNDSGIYYIEYNDVSDVIYLPLHTYRDVISAYVIIDNNNSGSSKYYVSMSDGTYGYPETLYEDITTDTIVPYSNIVERKNINYCRNTKQKATVGGLK